MSPKLGLKGPLSHDTKAGARPITVIRQGPHDHSAPRRATTHSYATLVFHRGGRSRIEQKGEWRLAAGDVMLVPAGEPHRALELRRSEYWGVAVCVSCFAADAGSTLLEPIEHGAGGGEDLFVAGGVEGHGGQLRGVVSRPCSARARKPTSSLPDPTGRTSVPTSP